MYQFLDENGNISSSSAKVVVIDKFGQVKEVSTGGGSPTGPAGGDLSGTYPNPSVVWANGLTTYDLVYYPLPTGTTSEYIRGDGSIVAFPSIPSVTPSALTKTDDTNVTLTLSGTPATALLQAVGLTLGWTGTLADSRIASATNWNTAYTNRITSLTTTGTSGAATLISNVLNIPQYQAVLTNPITGTGTTNELAYFTAASTLASLTTATYPSLTELSYGKGVTSTIQTQLDNRTKIVIKNITPSSALTGTLTETILSNNLISGGTFATNDVMNLVSLKGIKTGFAGTVTYKVYINTSSNTLTGAVQIAQLAAGANWVKMGQKTFTIIGGTLKGYSFTGNGTVTGFDIGNATNTEASTSYNPANNIYIIVTGQLTNTGDSVIQRELLITN